MEYRRGWRAFIRSAESRGLRDVDRQVLARIWSYARPYKGQMALIASVVLIQSLLGILPPLLYRHFIDSILPVRDLRPWVLFSALLLALPFLTVLIGLIQHIYVQRLGETLVLALRNTMFDHVHRLSMRFFTHTREGEIVARFTQDVEGARRMITNTIPQVTAAVFTLVSTLVIMGILEWRLALPGLLLFPLLWPFAFWLARILRRTHHRGLEYNAQLTSIVSENLSVQGAMLMKLFGQQKNARDQFHALSDAVRQFRIRWAIMSYWLTSGMGILSGVGVALFYSWGGWLVMQGEMSIGTIVAFVAYLPRLYRPIAAISHVPVELIQGIVSFERAFAYMDIPIEIEDSARARTLSRTAGRLAFEHVSFGYVSTRPEAMAVPEGNPARSWALHNVSFAVEPGQMVALAGLSGAGKSTLISLVMRLYDPVEGRILLDGHDLRDLTLDTLSAHIGMVSQDTYLFHDTLRANLLYARPEATLADLEEVCRMAHIHDFIQALPEGLDTMVGEHGHRLSGGEKQRISIARVLLKKPAILLLDEATSHLDSHSEALIQEALAPLLSSCTSVVIAHRLSTIRRADLILVLDRGRIAERGRHEELLKQGGRYFHLHALQYHTRHTSGPDGDLH